MAIGENDLDVAVYACSWRISRTQFFEARAEPAFPTTALQLFVKTQTQHACSLPQYPGTWGLPGGQLGWEEAGCLGCHSDLRSVSGWPVGGCGVAACVAVCGCVRLCVAGCVWLASLVFS